MQSQRERLLSRRVPPPPAPPPPRETQTVTVICDRCRRPVAVVRRRRDRPRDVTVAAYGRNGGTVRPDTDGWTLACVRHRDGRRFGPFRVSADRAARVCDEMVGVQTPRVTVGGLSGR